MLYEYKEERMKKMLITVIVIFVSFASLAGEDKVDPAKLFEKPVPLADSSGKPMITGKAQGCPFAADYNNDGKMDIILGAKVGMDTATGGIWLIPNKGTNEKPVFNWADNVPVTAGGNPVKVGCG
jgi:hypothetical protein